MRYKLDACEFPKKVVRGYARIVSTVRDPRGGPPPPGPSRDRRESHKSSRIKHLRTYQASRIRSILGSNKSRTRELLSRIGQKLLSTLHETA